MAALISSAPGSQADQTATHIATHYTIDQVVEITKGPYKPGDIIAFGIKTKLPLSEIHYFEVTGECFSRPTTWHRGTENKFVDNSYSRQGYAVAVITSGCSDGVHQVLEVEVEDTNQGLVRVSFDGENSLLSYKTINGHLVPNVDNSKRKADSISTQTLPLNVRMTSNRSLKIWDLPGLTVNQQTINWVANGACKFRRGLGEGDVSGRLIAINPGKCYISANTPWGSNLFQPVNVAFEINVFSPKALSCSEKKSKKQVYVEASRCPKGYSLG